MIDYNIKKDLMFIREMLELTQADFAYEINTTQISVAKWESDFVLPNEQNIEKIYNLAIKNDIYINVLKCEFYEDDKKDRLLLFHGSKDGIKGELSLKYANSRSDFGVGFYLGESYGQASSWVSDSAKGSVYCFYTKLKGLNVLKFDVDMDWMLAICVYRGYLDDKLDKKIIKNIIENIEKADVIYAPIADNMMYLTIQEFANGFITDEQCKHALSANRLGMQYVFKTNKALQQLKPVDRLYLSSLEKEQIKVKRLRDERDGVDKNKAARIAYRNKGKYIDEII